MYIIKIAFPHLLLHPVDELRMKHSDVTDDRGSNPNQKYARRKDSQNYMLEK
jgi:hypothetical protein